MNHNDGYLPDQLPAGYNPDHYSIRTRAGLPWYYNVKTKLFFNHHTGKHAVSPRPTHLVQQSDFRRYLHPEIEVKIATVFAGQEQRERIGLYLGQLVTREHYKRIELKGRKFDLQSEREKHHYLPAALVKNILGDGYRKTLEALRDIHVLDEYDHRQSGGRVYNLYRFSETRWLHGYRLLPACYKRPIDCITKYVHWKQNQFTDLDHRVVAHVIRHFPKVWMEREDFERLVEFKWLEKLDSEDEPEYDEDEYLESAEYQWERILEWNDSKELSKWMTFTVDHFGNRLHYLFTRVFSEVRQYLGSTSGEIYPMTEYDVVNCQPAIVAELLAARLYPNLGIREIMKRSPFIRAVVSTKIYEEMYVRWDLGLFDPDMNVDHLVSKVTESQRKWAKQNIAFPALYCQVFLDQWKRFQKLYPEESRVLGEIKTRPYDEDGEPVEFSEAHSNLPQMMQRSESEKTRPGWKTILRTSVKMLPIHDAIYLAGLKTEKQVKQMHQIISRQFKRQFRIPITVSCKDRRFTKKQ